MIENVKDLVGFLHSFHASILPTTGLPTSDIAEDIPEPLAYLYLELGALIAHKVDGEGPFSTQDSLLAVEELRRIDGMIEFAWENQGNWSCRTRPGLSDPPVFSNAAAYWEPPQNGFVRVCESLQHFLITLCLQEAVMSAPRLWQVGRNSRIQELFVTPVEPLWVDGEYVHGGPSHSFFTLPGHDALIMDFPGVWLGSHGDTAIELARPGVRVDRLR